MGPEDKAREHIDRHLMECGWVVQDFGSMNIMTGAGIGVAVREFPLHTGFADYLLYADGKVIGVVEAKPAGHTLSGVEVQINKYIEGLPEELPHYTESIPFAYASTGIETIFINCLDPQPRSRLVFTFHRPEELLRLVGLETQVRGLLRTFPALIPERLWRVQIEAIENLERSLADNRPRSLIQMATGSGKTYTACSFCYRLIKYAKAKRILFLVDRNNLGRQTLNEFQQYRSPYTGYQFTEEFNVQRLTKNTIDPASKVVVTTIQRLYSILKDEEDFDAEVEEGSLFESVSPLIREPLPVVYNPRVPIGAFDFIVVDECHRSIYNVWRQVLDYFDAFIIGLTATPTAQTVGYFNGNVVQDYSHEKAVADGVNVGYDVYRIETKVSQEGATLSREPGLFVPHRDKRTREKVLKELDDDLTYTANELDRDVNGWRLPGERTNPKFRSKPYRRPSAEFQHRSSGHAAGGVPWTLNPSSPQGGSVIPFARACRCRVHRPQSLGLKLRRRMQLSPSSRSACRLKWRTRILRDPRCMTEPGRKEDSS
ncbi:MAG: DEAD/DEAH box helicase family protein [Gemmatimonadota bacterium]